MKVGDKELALDKPVVMSIINVTPDSFYSDSRSFDDQSIIRRVDDAVAQGTSILDIGGYSTRPGAANICEEEEFERLSRGVRIIRERHPEMIISIDTFRSSVARKVMEKYGPCIINDVSGGDIDPAIVDLVVEYNVPFIAMHMGEALEHNADGRTDSTDIVAEVIAFFDRKVEQLRARGVEQIIIDPGFGFAKTKQQNYEILAGMDRMTCKGLPILAGVSRKSMIYKVLGVTPDKALAGTIALNWECLNKGAMILRVHDTREAVDVIKLHNYYKG